MNKKASAAVLFSVVSFLSYGQESVNPHSATDAAWSTLDSSLREGSTEHRQLALAALASIGSDNTRAVKAAIEGLQDKDSQVRKSAALALGEMKAYDADAELRKALEDTGEVSFAAAKALTEIGDASGRDVLITVLAGERKDVAPGLMTNAVRKGKEKLKHPEGLMLMGAQDATGAMFGPVSMVFPVVKDTLDLKGKGAPGRAAAAAYLARDPDHSTVGILEWALDDENEFVRLEAVKGLGQRGNAGSIPKLRRLLSDSHEHTVVRDFAAASIIRIEDRGGADGPPPAGPPAPVSSSKTFKP